jgi:hypothetical protein
MLIRKWICRPKMLLPRLLKHYATSQILRLLRMHKALYQPRTHTAIFLPYIIILKFLTHRTQQFDYSTVSYLIWTQTWWHPRVLLQGTSRVIVGLRVTVRVGWLAVLNSLAKKFVRGVYKTNGDARRPAARWWGQRLGRPGSLAQRVACGRHTTTVFLTRTLAIPTNFPATGKGKAWLHQITLTVT